PKPRMEKEPSLVAAMAGQAMPAARSNAGTSLRKECVLMCQSPREGNGRAVCTSISRMPSANQYPEREIRLVTLLQTAAAEIELPRTTLIEPVAEAAPMIPMTTSLTVAVTLPAFCWVVAMAALAPASAADAR